MALRECDIYELEELLKENPLTQKSLSSIVQNKIGEINHVGCIKKCMVSPSEDYKEKYDVYIGAGKPKELKLGVIHAAYHIHLGVTSLGKNNEYDRDSLKIRIKENKINAAALVFYENNKEFFDKFYKKNIEKFLKK